MAAATTTFSPATDPRVRWRPGTAGAAARIGVLALIALFVLAVPHLIPGTLVNVYSRAMVYGVVALSMNVLIGYAGQVSLGHQAFVGVGAFASAYLLSRLGMPWPLAVVGTVVLSAFIALGLGAVALRVKGLYFALVTIAYGVFVQSTVFGITALTGGGAGANAPRPVFAQADIPYAYVCVAGLLPAWAFDWRLTSSRPGRAIEALRDDERVAASWGINVKGYKLLAFAVAGGVAGLAGALFASVEQIVSPITFGLPLALTFVLMTVVGGLRSRPGVVIGGFVFAVLPTLLEIAHGAWGEGEAACATGPPRVVQFLVFGLVAAGMVERMVHAFGDGGLGAKIGWVVVGAPIALMSVLLAPGGFGLLTGLTPGWLHAITDYCLWGTLDAQFEPLIGAGLLILTLTQFPGGIAEQFAPVFRWLSFGPFAGDHGGSDG